MGRGPLWGAGDPVRQKFTGAEQDNGDVSFFQARYYMAGQGRFNSPDPVNFGADLLNPGSWNGYSYVLNSPLSGVDPDGLQSISSGDSGGPMTGISPGGAPPIAFTIWTSGGAPKVTATPGNALTYTSAGAGSSSSQSTFKLKDAPPRKSILESLMDQYPWLRSALTICPPDVACGTIDIFTPSYRTVFFKAYPELAGEVVVHHAIEQQVLKRFPGVMSEAEMHSLENLRGIPKEINNKLHLGEIRREWDQFYKLNPSPTLDQLLQKAADIDAKFGAQFKPPVR